MIKVRGSSASAKPRSYGFSGYCLACPTPAEPHSSVCRAHWLALPAGIRREAIRAGNAYRDAPDDIHNQERFRDAWDAVAAAAHALVEKDIDSPPPAG